jgi:hypothetical protein
MPKLPEQRCDQPFQRIPMACKTTGLSQTYLRAGCRAGTIPHIMSGNTYMINMPAFLRQLDAVKEDAS